MAVEPTDLTDQTFADERYPPEAYRFLLYGLEQTSSALHGEASEGKHRHVSGRDLSEGLRAAAMELWGLLAPVVLERWGIRRTRDFGEMVFFLIGLGVLGKQDTDRIEDFDDVYDFASAFQSYPLPVESIAE